MDAPVMPEIRQARKAKPEVDGTRYFKPRENETILVAEYQGEGDKKILSKMHKVELKKGVVYAAEKKHEIEACVSAKLREVSKPAPKEDVVELD
jgi:hypothetical protein